MRAAPGTTYVHTQTHTNTHKHTHSHHRRARARATHKRATWRSRSPLPIVPPLRRGARGEAHARPRPRAWRDGCLHVRRGPAAAGRPAPRRHRRDRRAGLGQGGGPRHGYRAHERGAGPLGTRSRRRRPRLGSDDAERRPRRLLAATDVWPARWRAARHAAARRRASGYAAARHAAAWAAARHAAARHAAARHAAARHAAAWDGASGLPAARAAARHGSSRHAAAGLPAHDAARLSAASGHAASGDAAARHAAAWDGASGLPAARATAGHASSRHAAAGHAATAAAAVRKHRSCVDREPCARSGERGSACCVGGGRGVGAEDLACTPEDTCALNYARAATPRGSCAACTALGLSIVER